MTPVWSSEAEQAVIGAVMLDPGALDRAGHLSADAFHSPAHQSIWVTIQELSKRHQPADVITTAQAMNPEMLAAIGGMAYLNDMAQSVPSSRNIKGYADIVREKARYRALLEWLDNSSELARGEGTTSEKLDKIASLMAPLTLGSVRKGPRKLSDIALARTGHYEELQAGRIAAGFPTGIPGLDKALNGGLRGGKLIFLGARPAVGKSSFAAQILISQARLGRPGLFLSQEMTGEEVADRGVSHLGRIDYERLQTGKMQDSDWSRAADMLDEMVGLPIWVDDQGSLTLSDIKAKVRLVPGIKVVVLDYLQLCAGSGGANRNSEIEEISRGLKALAMELDITIIALSQLNRKVEDRPGRRPQLSDLRDSGSIEQDADVILFLWPVRDLEDGGRLVGLGIDKNRQGRTAEVALDFRGAIQRWTESTEWLRNNDMTAPKARGFRGDQ